MLSKRKLEQLRKSARLHVNWLIASVLGIDILTKAERDELAAFNLKVKEISLAEKSFILGRLKALLRKSEWKNLNWESLEEASSSLSAIEKLAVEAARTRAAVHLKSLADDITNGVFLELQKAQSAAVSEASIKQVVADEVALGIIEKKHYKAVASSIAEKTKTAGKKRWENITRTELHAAKIQGTTQAIVNKVDVYAHSDGPDSNVSVIPHPGTCPDCADHYLDNTGTPIVFKLSDLIAAGSNADPGVNHKKVKGVHTHWKTTLPPMHPNCRCELVYIPPGYSWVSGKLTMTDPGAFKKAMDGGGTLAAKVKPAGPPQPNKPATPASVPGIKSPAQKTPGASAVAQNSTANGPQMQPCPFGGGPECEKHGGNGAKTHESGGAIMRAHQEALANGAQAEDPEAAAALTQETIKDAVEWGKQDHPHAVALDHLSKGKFAHVESLAGTGESGEFESYRVTIEGNGRGLLKPVTTELGTFKPRPAPRKPAGSEVSTYNPAAAGTEEMVYGILAGETSTVPGTAHHREEAAYNLHMAMGLTEHVPPTTVREHEGKQSSFQSWKEGYSPSSMLTGKNTVKSILEAAGPNAEKVRTKLEEGAVMQLVMNHGDGHTGNLLVKGDGSDVQFIDNSAAFGHGMYGCTSSVHQDMHSAGMKLKVPQHLSDKMSKTSYASIKRTCSKQSPTEQAHTFMRMRYIQHLQDTEGHLDYKKFLPVMMDHSGDPFPRMEGWPGETKEKIQTYFNMTVDEKLPHQQFTAFMKSHIEAAKDPSHPDHACVQQLQADVSDDDLFMDGKTFFQKKVLTKAKNVPTEFKIDYDSTESSDAGTPVPRHKLKKAMPLFIRLDKA